MSTVRWGLIVGVKLPATYTFDEESRTIFLLNESSDTEKDCEMRHDEWDESIHGKSFGISQSMKSKLIADKNIKLITAFNSLHVLRNSICADFRLNEETKIRDKTRQKSLRLWFMKVLLTWHATAARTFLSRFLLSNAKQPAAKSAQFLLKLQF